MRTASERVGRPVSRVEGFDKVTGRARYTADVDVPGLAHAVLVQTEIPHGRVTEESVRRAAEQVGSASGVLHVLTPLNCPALGQLPHELTFDLPLERRPPLSDLTVQHVGQREKPHPLVVGHVRVDELRWTGPQSSDRAHT